MSVVTGYKGDLQYTIIPKIQYDHHEDVSTLKYDVFFYEFANTRTIVQKKISLQKQCWIV